MLGLGEARCEGMLVMKPNAILNKITALMLPAFLGQADVPLSSDSLMAARRYFGFQKECSFVISVEFFLYSLCVPFTDLSGRVVCHRGGTNN